MNQKSEELGMHRCEENPIITVSDVKPSREGFSVVGIFNCGAAVCGEETILLCRVAECVDDPDPGVVRIPIVAKGEDGTPKFDTVTFRKDDPRYDFSDSRKVLRAGDSSKMTVALTTLSHLRVARSRDGIHFTVSDRPVMMPDPVYEAWGMEDPRITQIGEDYYIVYTSVAPFGITVSMIRTRDFQEFERMGVIFAPENKDVTIFPGKINGQYYAFNRPVPAGIGQPNMWIASSPDLIHWGCQKLFRTVSDRQTWDCGRVGGGAVPILTPYGWLKIYHAADQNDRYCLGAFLLKKDDPSVILGQLDQPLLEPETEYERHGFFDDVVFTCGALVCGEMLRIYYGAADDKICLAEIPMQELLDRLMNNGNG